MRIEVAKHHSKQEVATYLDDTLEIVRAAELDDDLKIPAFNAVFAAMSGKLMVPVQDQLPVMAIPRDRH